MKDIFLTGTDTNCGKTHAAALLMLRYPELIYWKPVQTGFPPDDDTTKVKELTGLPEERFLDPGFVFKEPLSPHRAAELEERSLAVSEILGLHEKHSSRARLLIEGAGGILVPINRNETWLDFLKNTDSSIIIASRTGLGTINHSCLTADRLIREEQDVSGFVFCGPENPDNVRTVQDFSGLPVLAAFDLDRVDLESASKMLPEHL